MVRHQKTSKSRSIVAPPKLQPRRPVAKSYPAYKQQQQHQQYNKYPIVNSHRITHPRAEALLAAFSIHKRHNTDFNSNYISNNNNYNQNTTKQPDLREMLNKQRPQTQKKEAGPAVDLRERLNEKRLKEEQQRIKAAATPRPILGQNPPGKNYLSSSSSSSASAFANGSALILAQRDQQYQLHQKQRAELLATQQRQQQQQQQKQQHQKQMVQQQNQHFGQRTSLDVQDRLKVRIQNDLYTNEVASKSNSNSNSKPTTPTTAGAGGNSSGYNSSAGPTPESSPAILSAGAKPMDNPFPQKQQQQQQPSSQPQPQPQFHKRNVRQSPPQKEQVPKAAPPTFNFNPNDPLNSLAMYCSVRGYAPPKYNSSIFSKLHLCTVNVNGSIYRSYEHQYEQLARIQCAQKAIEEISIIEARHQLPPCTDNDFVLIDKLYQELLKRPNGIVAKNIPNWFEETYKQTLPEHWRALVQKSNKFLEEGNLTNGIAIVYANTEEDKDDGSITLKMDGISLPWQNPFWNLIITYCASTTEIWARLFDFSQQFANMCNEIECKEKKRAVPIVTKQYYLVNVDGNCWSRVRVEKMNKENKTALCFFFDYGDSDWIPMEKLYECEPRFLQLPAQAVRFSLFGLDDFSGFEQANVELESLLMSKSLVAEVLTKEAEFYAEELSTSGRIQVVLFDTSTEKDVNLNDELLKTICKKAKAPTLKTDEVNNVLITHISNQGDIYLQIANSELSYMQKLIQKLIESKFNSQQHTITKEDLKMGNMFLICVESEKDVVGPSYMRGTLSFKPFKPEDKEVEIYYVDTGKTQITHTSKIFRLESLSTALSKFPRQAIKTLLHNIPPINATIVGRLRALLPYNSEALVKVNVRDATPLITVYKRNPDIYCTINDVIRLEVEAESFGKNSPQSPTQTKPDIQSSEAADGAGRTDSPSAFVELTRGLTIRSMPSSPQRQGDMLRLANYEVVPEAGSFIEVRVTLSANPSNFMIQPYKDYTRLRDMMKELQEYCENNDEFIPPDMVEIGQAYAAKNSDGFYHRVTVENTYNVEMIHVCFCDFGDIAILRSDQLKILPSKFRKLPKMAIQAKLHGIKPSSDDWTLEECLRFRELTVGKKFAALILDICQNVCQIHLVDVSTEDDIYIHQQLLDEKRAIRDVKLS